MLVTLWAMNWEQQWGPMLVSQTASQKDYL
jgi:hypothetical protein